MVKSADRVFIILETIANNSLGMTHSELAEALNIPKSSLTSLLVNLQERNYIVYNPENKRYTLGSMILFLAGRYLAAIDLVQIGLPVVNELMAKTGESSGLTIKSGSEVLSVYSKNSLHPIMRSMNVGDRAPIYATAAGRSMLAFMDEGEIEQYLSSTELKRITSKTITDPDQLRQELKKIRTTGVAYDREELFEDSTAIAAPVFDMAGNPVASVRVVLPSMRCTGSTEKLIEEAVRQAGRQLSEKLGNADGSKHNQPQE